MIFVDVPIACCPTCMANFTVSEWGDLKLLETTASLERRACSECDGGSIALRPGGLTDLDFSMPVEEYAAAFGLAGRAAAAIASFNAQSALAYQRDRRRRVAAVVATFVALCLVILAAAYLHGS